MLDPFRGKRKMYFNNHCYNQPTGEPDLLKPPEHDLIQNSPDNYVVTPHRKRRSGFYNSPAHPPFLAAYHSSYIEDLRSRKGLPASTPPSYFPGKYIYSWRRNSVCIGYVYREQITELQFE